MKILIGICSCAKNGELRQAIRETWMPEKSEAMEAVFFVGPGGSTEDDIVVLDAPDDYEHLPAKVLAFYRHALNHMSFDYLFKCDDDTYVATERLPELATGVDMIGNEFLDGPNQYASGGAGYLLSRNAVAILSEHDQFPSIGDEDLIFTRFLVDRGVSPKI